MEFSKYIGTRYINLLCIENNELRLQYDLICKEKAVKY